MRRKEDIMAEVGELDRQIQGYDWQISGFKGEIAKLEDRIQWLNSQIGALEEKSAVARDRKYQLNQISFCDNCGSEVSAEDLFCQYCGSRILKQTSNIQEDTCPQCGAYVEPGSRFCTHCGFRLMDGSQEDSASNNMVQDNPDAQYSNAFEPEGDSPRVSEKAEESIEKPEFLSPGSREGGDKGESFGESSLKAKEEPEESAP
ncbi:MAG: zinc ribbon domain-containing protein, partial [Lachnospiraceae bacterium]|nr:zinc ribbon domain-containing protein [Lachnospiraceae bacterium]